MAQLTGNERSHYVQSMFASIARRYDLMNRLITMAQDRQWRIEVIERAELHSGDHLLDLGSGTGDLVFEAVHHTPGAVPVAADFTIAMMQVGRDRPGGRIVPWVGADALALPFTDGKFDAIVSGFLMRNVSNLPLALAEQYRLLKPGGRIVILDTTRRSKNWLSPLIYIYLQWAIPLLGWLIAGNSDAYTYLPDSTESFLSAETLAERMQAAGFQRVGFRRRMLGTIAIHFGVK